MESTYPERQGQDMDGIRIDSAAATETSSIDEPSSPETEHPDESCLFELGLTSTKGYGLFATRRIPRGTCIVEEAALVSMDADVAKTGGPVRAVAILAGIEALTAEQLDAYNDLHLNTASVDPNMRAVLLTHLKGRQYTGHTLEMAFKEHVRMVAIFNTNAVDVDHGRTVFPTFSRCNHSCTPNVANCFNTVTEKHMLHAVRDIEAGEEICVSYIDKLWRSLREREESLGMWGFECECAACEVPGGVESMRRRMRMAEIHEVVDREQANREEVLSGRSKRSSKQAAARLSLSEELAELCIKEKLVGMNLAQAYNFCSHYAVETCRLLKAIEYAEKSLEVERTCVGHVHEIPDSAVFWLEDLRKLARGDDKRFRAELERVRREEERVVRKEEREAARVASRKEIERKKAEEERSAKQKQAEKEALRQQREEEEKAVKAESKKEKGAVKTAVKKAKWAIRAAVAQAEDAEKLIAGLSGEELLVLAGKMYGGGDVKGIVGEALEKVGCS